ARVSDVTFTDNAFLHGASVGIKFSAFAESDEDGTPLRPGTMDNIHVENNLLAFSEIGISFGGNGTGHYRFSNSVVRGNVFTELGSDNSTGRSFNWAIDLQDHRNLVLEDNYFVNQPWNTNVYGIKIGRAGNERGGRTNDN